MSNLVASLKIIAQNGASKVFGQIANDARKMGGAFRPVTKDAGAADRAIARVGVGAAPRFAAIRNGLRRLNDGGFRLAEKGAYGLGRGIGSALRSASKFAVQWAAIGAGAGAAGVGAFGFGIIKAASDFEQFQVILENTEGSAAKARQSMDWVKQFAKTTPYEVANVMEAYVQLRSYGIDPMAGSLKSLGNAASGMNKDIMQAVEMLADAQTGEFERLKEFGIRAKVNGSAVAFSYMQSGKEVTRTAKNNARDIQKSILGIFDAKFGGMMDRQSRTLKGTWSNIKDMFAGFQLDVADAGIFDLIKSKAQAVLSKFQQWAKDGTLKRWAKETSEWITKLVEKAWTFIETTNWSKVGSELRDIGTAAWTVAKAFAAIVNAGVKFNSFIGYLQSGQGDSDASKWLTKNVGGWAGNTYGEISNRMNGGAYKPPSAPAIKSRTNGAPLMPRLQGANPFAPPRAQAPVKVGGALDINIMTEPGTRASVSRLSSNNKGVPINVGNRGSVSFG